MQHGNGERHKKNRLAAVACASWRIRTSDPQIRSLILYPAELKTHLYVKRGGISADAGNDKILVSGTFVDSETAYCQISDVQRINQHHKNQLENYMISHNCNNEQIQQQQHPCGKGDHHHRLASDFLATVTFRAQVQWQQPADKRKKTCDGKPVFSLNVVHGTNPLRREGDSNPRYQTGTTV